MKYFNLKTWAVLIVVSWTIAISAKERTVSHNLELTDPTKVAMIEVSLMQGTINIEGYKGKSVEIVATVSDLAKVRENDWKDALPVKTITHVNGDNERKRPSTKGLKKVEKTNVNIDIEELNNKVSIVSHTSRQNIMLTIKVPFSSNLDIELHRSEGISINNVHGNIEIESSMGPISAKGVRGSIVAESSSSDLSIVFEEFNLDNPSSLTVHRGDIDVTLPKKSSATIEVKNYDGEIFSGLDVEFENVDKVEKGNSRGRQQIVLGGSMQATINGGKQKLKLNTLRGDMFIRTK